MTETNARPSDATEPVGEPRDGRRGRIAPRVMLSIGAVVVLVDQAVKILAVAGLEGRPPVGLVGDVVRLVLLRNPGAAFSLGTDVTVVFGLIAAVVVIALLWFSRRVRSLWWAWGLGLVLGGAAGNLVDRLLRSPGPLRGHVVDYLSVGWWPVFNIADACLVTGVVALTVAVVFGVEHDGVRRDRADAGSSRSGGAASRSDGAEPADG